MPTIVSQAASTTPNILLLGGTTQASALAEALAERGLRATLSYAGRTAHPKPQPIPVRVGGFGGVKGLAAYLRRERVTHLIDATHPFAATMRRNAVLAAAETGTAHIVLTRPPWRAAEGDRWRHVADIPAAVDALSGPPQRVMLALGRMHVDAFAAQPHHAYLLRFVDLPETLPDLPRHVLVVDRGPFDPASDVALLQTHAIDLLVCKNAGGSGASAKLIAARTLGLPVLMIDRPPVSAAAEVYDVATALRWLGHAADLGV
jgi:precorrin-6A/cobalt-precorrin-6A reductase